MRALNMGKLRAGSSFGLGGSATTSSVFSKNHFSSETKQPSEVKQKIASMGLNRVAGNVYECPSTKDFWKVQGTKVVRMATDEVDNGESLAAAPHDTPANFLASILDDLTF
jgi:hypothetical protein